MSTLPVRFHPEAVAEAEAAVRWYGSKSALAAGQFVQELTRTIDVITEAPGRWPIFEHGTRRLPLHRFPYLVIYHTTSETIEIVAVAHGRRRPGYWRPRVDQ